MGYDVTIRILEPPGLLNLRAGASARPPIEATLGRALPREPNSTAECNGLLLLCLGPDEWLLRTSDGAEIAWAAQLQRAAAGTPCAVTPVSDAYTAFEDSGPEACEVLRQGTGIDLHPRSFGPGRCARTRFAKTRALLYQADTEPTYQVYVPLSYAQYLMQWFEHCRGG